jgi:glycosyltransferase involved in cell wall biosynthesis
LLVDPSDASEFADAITRLLQDRAAADRIGGEGLRTVLEAYSWEMIGARHLEFYGAFLT